MEIRFRTRKDDEALCREAERRVRLGVPYRQVAEELQLPLGTISRWAGVHGFRHMDIESERLTGRRAPPPAGIERWLAGLKEEERLAAEAGETVEQRRARVGTPWRAG